MGQAQNTIIHIGIEVTVTLPPFIQFAELHILNSGLESSPYQTMFLQ